jgi:uncharacterized membrane protein YoaK (UPF0700 family)
LVPLRNTDSSRAPSFDVAEPRGSLSSISPSSMPGASSLPGMSLAPSANVHLHSALLSGVAGYVDAAGFASLFGLFPAHLTGELVGDAIAFSSAHPREHATHFWMLPVFVCSVIVAAFAARVLRRSGQRPLAGLLALITVALALFSLSEPLARAFHESARFTMLASGGCAVAAMGFQNALMRESLITSCPTTVMTGNLTLVVIDLADRVFCKLMRPSPRDRRPRSRLGPVALALGAFLICAVLGGLLTRACGSLSVALPTLVTGVLAYGAWREERARDALRSLASGLGPARLPSFESTPPWPDSVTPRPSGEPVSMTQLKSAQVLPPALETPGSGESRAAEERRTNSGTQLIVQRYRDGK